MEADIRKTSTSESRCDLRISRKATGNCLELSDGNLTLNQLQCGMAEVSAKLFISFRELWTCWEFTWFTVRRFTELMRAIKPSSGVYCIHNIYILIYSFLDIYFFLTHAYIHTCVHKIIKLVRYICVYLFIYIYTWLYMYTVMRHSYQSNCSNSVQLFQTILLRLHLCHSKDHSQVLNVAITSRVLGRAYSNNARPMIMPPCPQLNWCPDFNRFHILHSIDSHVSLLKKTKDIYRNDLRYRQLPGDFFSPPFRFARNATCRRCGAARPGVQRVQSSDHKSRICLAKLAKIAQFIPGGGHAAELQRNPEAHSGTCDTCDTCGTHTGAHCSTCTFDIGVNHVSACKLGDVESRCFVKRIDFFRCDLAFGFDLCKLM